MVLLTFIGLLVISTMTSALQYGEPRVNIGFNVTLKCPFIDPNTIWLLPDGTGVDATPSDDVNYRYQVDGLNGTLFIEPVILEDDGYYTCLVHQTEKPTAGSNVWTSYRIRLMVVPDVFYGDVWEHYEEQFIIGFIASGTIVALVLFFYLLQKFRWRPPKEDKVALQSSDPEAL